MTSQSPSPFKKQTLAYVAIICLAWALVPTLFFPNPPLDVVEGHAWGRELALGYTKHPPMQAWLLEAAYRLTGGHTFGAYWISQICIALAYLSIWFLGKGLGLSEKQRFWSIVLTSVTFYFTIPSPEFNPNVLQLPVWAAMILFFHRSLTHNRLIDWAILGALAAFGLYSKYYVALLIGSIGLYALAIPYARKVLPKPGPYIAAAVCVLLLLPHLYWMWQTDFMTIKFAGSRSHSAASFLDYVVNPLSFLSAQLVNHVGIVLVLLVGFGTAVRSLRQARRQQPEGMVIPARENRLFLLWFGLLPLFVSVLFSALTGNEFEHMWGTPLFTLSGILAVYLAGLPSPAFQEKRGFITAALLQLVLIGIIFGQAVLEPKWKTKSTRIHYPGAKIAAFLENEWHDRMGTPLDYVAGDMWSAANVTLHGTDRPHFYYEQDPILSPWIDTADVQRHGVMLIWRGDNPKPPQELRRFYPDAIRDGSKTFDFFGNGTIPPVTVNWTIIPPGQVVDSPR